MDPRRASRTVSDPKIRQVGFFAPPPDRSLSGPPDPISTATTAAAAANTSSSPPISDLSPSGNSLSPVMIPPPRHSSDTTHRPAPFPPASPLRRDTLSLTVGSYNNNNIIISSSPTASFCDESKGISVKVSPTSAASSFPGGGFDPTAVKASSVPASGLTTVSVVKTLPPGFTGIACYNDDLLS